MIIHFRADQTILLLLITNTSNVVGCCKCMLYMDYFFNFVNFINVKKIMWSVIALCLYFSLEQTSIYSFL